MGFVGLLASVFARLDRPKDIVIVMMEHNGIFFVWSIYQACLPMHSYTLGLQDCHLGCSG